MRSLSEEQQVYRIVEPLVDVGLDLEHIRTLLFRLAFEAAVSEGRAAVECVTTVVRDEPPQVRAAWMKVIGRMIKPDAPVRRASEGAG